MNKLFLIIVVLFSLSANGQFHYDLYSIPDSATVFVNGEQTCITPCRTKFYWKDRVDDKMIFTLKVPGYETWADTLTEKPYKFDFLTTAKLDRKLPTVKLDSITPVVGFDKLIAKFEDGTKIGTYKNNKSVIENIVWEGRYKVGESSFLESFYQIISDQGLETPFNGKIELFKNDEKKIRLPRYMVGAQITDYKIRLEATEDLKGASEIKGVTSMVIEWKVLDKKTNTVVLSHSNSTSTHYRQSSYTKSSNNLMVFEDALYEFLRNSNFYDLLNTTKVSIDYASAPSDSTINTENPQRSITLPSIPEFEKLSDMIKYANPACVTIITDGGFGSGVVINNEGYVLSAYHVVEGVNQIDVKFSSGLTLNAEIIAFDAANDIVLLDINGSGFPALPVSISQDVPLGEEVITIGTPASIDLGQSIARGLVSGKRLIEERVYLQADISVSPGNSGGPLLNSQGEIIGIVQSKIVTEGVEGIGFALPMYRALERLNLKVVVD